MDNKNEKTFADLFSSIDEEDNKETARDEVTTFDSLISEVFDGKNDGNNISFDDIKDIAEEKDEQVSEKDNIDGSLFFENTDNLSFDDNSNAGQNVEGENVADIQGSSLIFDSASLDINDYSDAKNMDLGYENKNNLFVGNVDDVEVQENSNLSTGEVEKSKENNLFFDNDSKLDKNESSVESDNLFFNNEEDSEKTVEVRENSNLSTGEVEKPEENNLFFDNGSELDKNESSVELDNLFFNNEEGSEKTVEIHTDNNLNIGEVEKPIENNLFFDNSVKEETNQPNSNLENLVTNGVLVSGVSINQMVGENEVNRVLSDKEKVSSESVSPFFDESNQVIENNGTNILTDKKITFDQTKKVNSKLDKLELSGTKNFNVKLVRKKVPLIKFLMGVISYAFFIFLVLILVTLLAYVLDIKIRAAKGDYSAPKFNAYVVLTGSMLPEIKVKDVVVTKKVDVDTLKVGDIITFASSDSRFLGTIITHRIIKKNQDTDGNITFQTRGDNNNVADSALVQPNNIYGKVILKIPKLGYLQDFLATQGGWIIVILLPCVTVISYDIVKLAKGIKKKKNKIKVIK